MKKMLMILFGTLLLAGCGSTQQADNSDKEDTPVIEEQEVEENSQDEGQSEEELFQETEELGEVIESSESANHDNLTDFAEFNTLSDHIDLDTHSNIVKTDNKGNRVILFKNEQGHMAYKSVYVKHKDRLKIIHLPEDKLVFNEVIQTTDSAKHHTNDDGSSANNEGIKSFPEFNIIAEHIDLDAYSGTVQTDNRGNRVITFADANGHKKYKSIFVKRDNRLKIVHFDDDGLIFNEII